MRNKFGLGLAIFLAIGLTGCKSAEEAEFIDTLNTKIMSKIIDPNTKDKIAKASECTSKHLRNEFEIRGLEEDQSFRAITASIKTQDISYLNSALSGSYQRAIERCF